MEPQASNLPLEPVGKDAKVTAGGGTAVIFNKRAQRVEKFNQTLTKYLTTVYQETNNAHGYFGTRQGIVEFLHHEQGISRTTVEEALPADTKSLNVHEFIDILSGAEANDVFERTLSVEDSDHPISNYFISSSHNTYLTGNQLYSVSSADAYKNVLLRGCRCVEIDVWDGDEPSDGEEEEVPKESKGFKARLSKIGTKIRKHAGSVSERRQKSPDPTKSDSYNEESDRITPWNSRASRAEPRVLHGHTATKEIPFRAVCAAIRDCAFVTSEHPVIVSLEVHTGLEQQQIMIDIMEEYWSGMLVRSPSVPEGEEVPLPTLKDLHKKILIKVKYSPKPAPNKTEPTQLVPEKMTRKRASTVSSTSSSSIERDGAGEQHEKKKKKMLDALSELGVYTRSYHFGGFDQPEAKVPTHVFSLSETALMEVHKTSPSDLFTHNKNFLMRAYPKGIRVSSSNLDPSVFWRKGVQIVALNWQKWDAGTMMNEAMFAGTGGWMLKPQGYRSSSISKTQDHACEYGKLDLSIEFFAGQDITLPPEEDDPDKFKPYIKCELHVETSEERTAKDIPKEGRAKGGQYKRRTKTVRGVNPDFQRETVCFKDVPNVDPNLAFIRFKVMDDERLHDDLAGWACYRLDRLQKGFRMIHLYDWKGEMTKGILFARIKMNLEMIPSVAQAIEKMSIKP